MIRIENINFKKRVTIILFTGLMCLGVAYYAYLLNKTIINGIYIEKAGKELFRLNVSVLELESQYFKAKNSVTLSLAKDLGFSDAGSQLYISRKANGHALSLKNEPR